MRLKLSFIVLCLLAGCGVPKPPTVEGKNLRPINPGYPDHYAERTLSAAQPPTEIKRASPVRVTPESTNPVAVDSEPTLGHSAPVSRATGAAPAAVVMAVTPETGQSASLPAPPSDPVAVPDYSSPLFAMPTGVN